MRRALFACLLMAISLPAFAGVQCTSEPKEKWLPESRIKQIATDLGHKIVVFKISSGNCYEIYGRDNQDRRIEIYFSPIDGTIVKQNTL